MCVPPCSSLLLLGHPIPVSVSIQAALIKYMEATVPKNKQALVPVLSTILRFTPEQLSAAMTLAKGIPPAPPKKGSAFAW